MALWTFTAEELLGIHQPDLRGILCLEDFKQIQNQYLHSRAHHTLGYELWLRNIRDDLQKGLLQKIRETIQRKELLAKLDNLGREVGDAISQMLDSEETHIHNPPQPIRQARLIRIRNRLQAQEVVRYLEAAEVAHGEVVSLKLNQAGRRVLADTYRRRAVRSYLPAIRTYYSQRAKYLDHLEHSPGTPFYPGRPPKRRYGSAWYPAGQQSRSAIAEVPWRPVHRPWAVESKNGPETNDWSDLERRMAARTARLAAKRPSTKHNDGAVPVKAQGHFQFHSPSLAPKRPKPEQANTREAEDNSVVKRQAPAAGATFAHNPLDLSQALLAFAQSMVPTGKQASHNNSNKNKRIGAPAAKPASKPAARAPGGEDSEPEGSDTSYEGEADELGLSTRRARPLPGQGTYAPPPPVKRLRKRNGGSDWQRHYDALCARLDRAKENNYWARMQEPAVAEAVSEMAAECAALAPAAAAVLRTKGKPAKKHTLGYGDWEVAKLFAKQFFKICKEVTKARGFVWRSEADYAVGIEKRGGAYFGVI